MCEKCGAIASTPHDHDNHVYCANCGEVLIETDSGWDAHLVASATCRYPHVAFVNPE